MTPAVSITIEAISILCFCAAGLEKIDGVLLLNFGCIYSFNLWAAGLGVPLGRAGSPGAPS